MGPSKHLNFTHFIFPEASTKSKGKIYSQVNVSDHLTTMEATKPITKKDKNTQESNGESKKKVQ